jgi:IS5 family transposase
MRSFVGIDLGVAGASDDTTVCKYGHLLERNKLDKTFSSWRRTEHAAAFSVAIHLG